jgi:DNA-binding response OmpR family regulator
MGRKEQKVLVVDHDADARTTCVSAIASLGCHILQAHDGEQGYEKFLKETVHLVISADRMPGLTGIEMVRKIREKDLEVPILLLSGETSGQLQAEVKELGGCSVLTRPFYPWQFRSVVEAALPRRDRRQIETPTRER